MLYDYGELDNLKEQTLTISGLQYSFKYTVNNDTAYNRVESANIYSTTGGSAIARSFAISYDYNAKGQVTGTAYSDAFEADYAYDEMGRLISKAVNSSNVQDEEYIYRTYTRNGVTYATNQLECIDDKTNYSKDSTSTYDENGNITGISYNGNSYTYTYDAVGRLTQEKKNGEVQKNYSYDDANNIQMSGLTYVNGKLTSANGKPIQYDEMGNPTTYKGQKFTWEQGRKLTGGTMNGKSFAYAYDGNGMRYKKVVNGISTEYYYNGTQLLMENRNGDRICYIYGQTGVEGMIYVQNGYANKYYYFDKNTLGDIIAIRDQNGNIVATYEYDAWGNGIVMNEQGVQETSDSFIGNINPFRYRGYYYDAETGFYYLQTRYYDPEICRFINADDYELIATLAEIPGQLNLYAYCNNNPLMFVDYEGNFIFSTLLIGAIVGFGVQFISSVISQKIAEGEIDWTAALIDGAFGAAAGMVGATGLGAIATGVINAGLSLTNGFITTGIETGWEFSNAEIIGIVGSSAFAGITSGIGKHFAVNKIRDANSFSKKIRGRISSGFYNKKGHVAKSVASASRAANSKILSVHFGKRFYLDYIETFVLTFGSEMYNFYIR